MDIRLLIKEAYEAQKYAYVPYSHFRVGAALLCKNGEIYRGCNVENASYGAANCAERTAVFKAVSDGKREFRQIAIVGNLEGQDPEEWEYCAPCGICRQVLREFCHPGEFQVVLARSLEEYRVYTLEELLPESFGPDNLRENR